MPKLVDNQLTTFRIHSRYPQWLLWPLVFLFLCLVLYAMERYLHWWTLTEVLPEITEVDSFGVVHQSTDYTCVPAAMTTLLRQQGVDADQRKVADLLGTTIFGTYPWCIPPAGEAFGFTVRAERLTFRDLASSPDPILIYNKFKGSLHVTYVPPGRLSDKLASVIFADAPGPFLPVMDPVDGLVIMDHTGYERYFGNDEPKDAYRFTRPDKPIATVDLDKFVLSGNVPGVMVGQNP